MTGGVAIGEGFIATNNQIISRDADHYFQQGIIVHGQQGGWNGVTISNNYVQGITGDKPIAGMIGTSAYSSKPITDIDKRPVIRFGALVTAQHS